LAYGNKCQTKFSAQFFQLEKFMQSIFAVQNVKFPLAYGL